MSNNIVLIGFMGTGKDSVGRIIADKTGMTFLSTDKYIELNENNTIEKIFYEKGEQYFRKLEKETILKIKDLKNIILATGGGIVIDNENRILLKKIGKVIHLDTDLKVIKERLKYDNNRPLIKNSACIEKYYYQRSRMYKFASIKFATSYKKPEIVADKIIKELKILKKPEEKKSKTILIKTKQKHYPVHIGYRLLEKYSRNDNLFNFNSKRVVIITNPLVGSLYLDALENAFKNCGIEPINLIIPDGEEYKNINIIAKIYNFLLRKTINRKEPIIALGGGIIGDIAGFVASTYKRGTPFVQIPTTLLSQVDSSIGGKTGINHQLGKNIIGTFYQPDLVISDVGMLLSQSDNEFKNGLAEVIKYGIIKNKDLISVLIKKKKEILNRDMDILFKIISKCIHIKKDIVEKDEIEEKGIREILNFGHTIGHAIESLTGYSKYSHGEAISIGMVEEAKIAKKNGFLGNNDLERMINLISSYRLPSIMPKEIKKEDIKVAIMQDKKVRNGKLLLTFPTGIGISQIMEVRCENFL